MPKEIVALTSSFMNNPARILIKDEEVTLLGITQYYVILKNEYLIVKLKELLSLYPREAIFWLMNNY
jgi:translation initiation factor 4A